MFTQETLGFPWWLSSKEPAIQETTCNAETWVLSLGWEGPPGERNGNPLQYSLPGNPMDRGAGWLQSMGSQELDTTQ